MSKYPEHDKLKAIQPYSQKIGSFLAWAQARGWCLCYYDDNTGEHEPVRKSIRDVLAEYFEIDAQKLEDEKEAMYETMRALSEPRPE